MAAKLVIEPLCGNALGWAGLGRAGQGLLLGCCAGGAHIVAGSCALGASIGQPRINTHGRHLEALAMKFGNSLDHSSRGGVAAGAAGGSDSSSIRFCEKRKKRELGEQEYSEVTYCFYDPDLKKRS